MTDLCASYRAWRAYHDQSRHREVLTMALKPRVKVKAVGIPIGNFEAVVDAAGKMRVKPKRKPRPVPQEIAARKRKKWRPAR